MAQLEENVFVSLDGVVLPKSLSPLCSHCGEISNMTIGEISQEQLGAFLVAAITGELTCERCNVAKSDDVKAWLKSYGFPENKASELFRAVWAWTSKSNPNLGICIVEGEENIEMLRTYGSSLSPVLERTDKGQQCFALVDSSYVDSLQEAYQTIHRAETAKDDVAIENAVHELMIIIMDAKLDNPPIMVNRATESEAEDFVEFIYEAEKQQKKSPKKRAQKEEDEEEEEPYVVEKGENQQGEPQKKKQTRNRRARYNGVKEWLRKAFQMPPTEIKPVVAALKRVKNVVGAYACAAPNSKLGTKRTFVRVTKKQLNELSIDRLSVSPTDFDSTQKDIQDGTESYIVCLEDADGAICKLWVESKGENLEGLKSLLAPPAVPAPMDVSFLSSPCSGCFHTPDMCECLRTDAAFEIQAE
jgi:hypothetical protein